MKKLILNAPQINNYDYFKANGVDTKYFYGSLPGIFPLMHVASKPNEQGIVVDLYAPDVMDAVRNIVSPGQYDEIVFAFDPAQYSALTANTGGYTYGEDVYLGTQLAVVRIDGHEDLYEKHEGMHQKTHKLQRLGYPCGDDMDMTLINGVPTPYYHNEDPSFYDGNYHRTWNDIRPFIAHLEDKCPIIKQSSTYNPWAFSLQLQLLSLGYQVGIADGKFGPKTLAVVRDIQKQNGLTVDGVFGPKTSACLKKKDNFMNTIELTKWKLIPDCETKAFNMLVKCKNAGLDIRITEGYRSNEEQAKDYAQGRFGNKGPIITNANAGQSKHNFGKAFDVCFVGSDPYPSDDAKWKAIADIGKECGLTPGYYFKSFQDKPHFEIA